MQLKLTVLIILILSTLLGLSCSGTYEGKPTGIKYILSKSAMVISPGQNQDKQEPDLLPPVEAEGFSQEPSEKLSEKPSQGPSQEPSEELSGSKTAYLTFDDGPNNLETAMILDILDSYGVKGTFFVVGTNIEKYPAVLKDLIQRGHSIGNHTYDHRYTEVYASDTAFLDSVKKNEGVIFEIGGIRPQIVRDPGGEVRNNKVLKNLLAENGYTLVDWNLDSYDSRKPRLDGAEIVEIVRNQAANPRIWSNMIILMHDGKGHLNTVRALPTIIEMLKNQGFKFAILE